MGSAKWIGIAIIVIAAAIGVIYFMFPDLLPTGLPWEPVDENNCEIDTVYQAGDCDCPGGTAEWKQESEGWVCVPVDPSRLECGKPSANYFSTLECDCVSPEIWVLGDGDEWKCLEW